jgi:hypothetical protein
MDPSRPEQPLFECRFELARAGLEYVIAVGILSAGLQCIKGITGPHKIKFIPKELREAGMILSSSRWTVLYGDLSGCVPSHHFPLIPRD